MLTVGPSAALRIVDRAGDPATAHRLRTVSPEIQMTAGLRRRSVSRCRVAFGGVRGVLLMQSSGTGNCINMLSLIKGGHFPFLSLVSMRGDFGEGNPWQYPMGQAVEPVLQAMGIICLRIERPEEVAPTVAAALTMVFQGGSAVAVLLTQKLLGAKSF